MLQATLRRRARELARAFVAFQEAIDICAPQSGGSRHVAVPAAPPAGSPTPGFALVAAAGAAAAVSLGGLLASCDSKGPSPSHAEELVKSVWAEVVDDVQRADAKLPAGVDVTELQPPEVRPETGEWVVVRMPVRQGVDLKRVEQVLLDHRLGASTSGDNGASRFSFTSSSISWRSTSEGRTMIVTQREAAREIRFTIPSAYSREVPYIELRKQGELEQSDLALCAQMLSCANGLDGAPMAGTSQPGLHGRGGLFGDGWREKDPFGGVPFGGPFGGLAGFARQMEEFQELASAMEELVEDQMRRQSWGGAAGGKRDDDEARFSVLPRDRLPGNLQAPGSSGASRENEATRRQLDLKRQAQELEALGARVYLPEENEQMDWSLMAGYEEQKSLIEDIVLIGLRNPEVFSGLAARTRKDKKAQRPKAVLFDGPPGTGKTTSARIIAKQAAIPLVYIPLEAVASKWYGESEQKLSQMLNAAEAMGGCIIFLDEIDALATSRGGDMYEATRRLLGVLLRFIDGFEATQSIVVAATNRKQDLDAALLSRFDSIITFGLPDCPTRASILKHYATHLSDAELQQVAEASPGMSARDLRAICEVTERRWASSIVKGQQPADSLPPADAYLMAARARLMSKGGGALERNDVLAGIGRSLASGIQ